MLKTAQRKTTTIPLSQLVLSKDNMRTGKAVDDDFVESLFHNGVIQPLLVAQNDDGCKVVAGRRRLNGLNKLLNQKRIESIFPVPCILSLDEDNLKSLSIAENLHRKLPHPSEFYSAIRDLTEQGLDKSTICTTLQIDTIKYEQTMRLANLHTKIYRAYSRNELSDEQIKAFAATDSKKLQHQIWAESEYSLDIRPHTIKNAIHGEITSRSTIALFVTEEAYTAAGGKITFDLFSDTHAIHDIELMRSLALGKLEEIAAEFKTNNPEWSWVTTRLNDTGLEDLEIKNRFTPKYRKKTEDQKKAEETLHAKLTELEKIDYEEMTHDQLEEYDKTEDAIESLRLQQNQENQYYLKKEMKHSGVVVTIAANGTTQFKMGLQKKQQCEELKKLEKKKQQQNNVQSNSDQHDDDISGEIEPKYSQVLIQDMEQYRRAMLKAEILKHPELAIELLHYSMIVDTLTERYYGLKYHDITTHRTNDETSKEDYADSKMCAALDTYHNKLSLEWMDHETEIGRLEAYISLNNKQKKALLTYASAITLQNDIDGFVEAETSVQYRTYYTPDHQNYFNRVPKDILIQHTEEITKKPATAEDQNATKTSLAQKLSTLFTGKNANKTWLPPLLRSDKK